MTADPDCLQKGDGVEQEGMREIFSLQWELNIRTLANAGKDFESTMNDPEQRLIWIENYRKALSAELAELIREVRDHGHRDSERQGRNCRYAPFPGEPFPNRGRRA